MNVKVTRITNIEAIREIARDCKRLADIHADRAKGYVFGGRWVRDSTAAEIYRDIARDLQSALGESEPSTPTLQVEDTKLIHAAERAKDVLENWDQYSQCICPDLAQDGRYCEKHMALRLLNAALPPKEKVNGL